MLYYGRNLPLLHPSRYLPIKMKSPGRWGEVGNQPRLYIIYRQALLYRHSANWAFPTFVGAGAAARQHMLVSHSKTSYPNHTTKKVMCCTCTKCDACKEGAQCKSLPRSKLYTEFFPGWYCDKAFSLLKGVFYGKHKHIHECETYVQNPRPWLIYEDVAHSSALEINL